MVQNKWLIPWVLLLLSSPIFSFTIPASLDSIMHHVYLQDYEYAHLCIAEDTTITSIDSLFFSLLVDNARMVDYESYVLDGSDYLEKVQTLLPNLLNSPEESRYQFYAATLLGSSGLVRVKVGEFVGGARDSRQSVKLLRETIQSHVDFLPAYAGIGLYTYYLSTTLSWLPFTSSGRDDGVDLIYRSVSANHPFLYSFLQSLFWVLLDEKRYDEAEQVAQRFLVKYPDNTLMLRGKVVLFLETNQFTKAYNLSITLQQRASNRAPINWADFFGAGRSRVAALRNQGLNSQALLVADSLLSVSVPAQVMEITWVQKHVKSLVSMKKDLE